MVVISGNWAKELLVLCLRTLFSCTKMYVKIHQWSNFVKEISPKKHHPFKNGAYHYVANGKFFKIKTKNKLGKHIQGVIICPPKRAFLVKFENRPFFAQHSHRNQCAHYDVANRKLYKLSIPPLIFDFFKVGHF